MRHKITVFIIFFICNCLLVNATFAIAGPNDAEITNMIFFGDSLTDIGNNTWILNDGIVGAPITNPNAQNIKFMWPNYLVQKKLNKPVFPSNQPNVSPFADSVSFAYAGAETDEDYHNTNWPLHTQASYKNPYCIQPGPIKDAGGNIKSTCNPGLVMQVNLYLKSVQFMPNPNTVFFIWAGSNDIFDYYNTHAKQYVIMTMLKSPYSGTLKPQQPLPPQDELNVLEQKVLHNINTAKQKLIDAGVKPEMIYILTLPDLSNVPALRTSQNWKLTIFFNRDNLEKSLSDVSLDLNQKLLAQEGDSKYAIPSSHFLQMDKILLDTYLNPIYKFTNRDNNCFEKQAMPACVGYVFYDKRHPTTVMHEMIADVIKQRLDNDGQ